MWQFDLFALKTPLDMCFFVGRNIKKVSLVRCKFHPSNFNNDWLKNFCHEKKHMILFNYEVE